MIASHDQQVEATSPETELPVGRRLKLLNGIKVLDLTHFLAGPYASMVLADLGADVLKVERPTGDSTRHNPPYFLGDDSAYFLSINRNKRSIALNLRTEKDRDILRRLIEGADVVIDNLRAPQRRELGLTFEDLQAINPRVVACSLTGFGSTGPYRDRPAYDIIVEALAGVMSLTGPSGGPSVRAGVPIGDIAAGLYAAIAVLAGVVHRDRTGQGMHLDVGMLDCQVSLLSYLAQYYLTGGYIARHQGRGHESIPTYNTFLAADGVEIAIAANTEDMWRSLCDVLNLSDLVSEPRFATNRERLKYRDDLIPVLAEAFARRESVELLPSLIAAGVPAAPIQTIDAALVDPQVRDREMVVTAPHRSGVSYQTLGVPIKSPAMVGEAFTSPPGLDEHADEVLKALGLSDTSSDQGQEGSAQENV